MELTKISENNYYFSSSINVGYVHEGQSGLLIDAGLDAQAMKKIIKQLKENNLPLTHLFITHAHADHYGGAAFLQKQQSVYTIAPKFEEAILRYPLLEPLYLFQGTKPLKTMRTKFLEGAPITIDEVVEEGQVRCGEIQLTCLAFPGHSEYQLGVISNGYLYAADSYFGMEALHKHKIPYVVDVDDTLKSLQRLLQLSCKGAVPGHGAFEETFYQTVAANIIYHEHILKEMEELLTRHDEGLSQEELIYHMCEFYEIEVSTIASWMLFRTAITAYATKLVKDEKATFLVKKAALWIQST
ncbi:MBL fold metallo-hydrolase [Metabacillus iocasae]|uniref:Glyoxylase-like metal-dependent hydrolase (Beta-lactamase superfamily II) n=1 Tax=Priestia iocasae TaxID=2291674 RepID=A0ABS2QUX7_9BACI|nr:MBL fold metallo-hydrolase [Metabacillus iocasae]MBM7702526.1 glyoxylase-like metal-dependent hydrolase (beta-lactamase superfamily II) [Metabacillus iocasae]